MRIYKYNKGLDERLAETPTITRNQIERCHYIFEI